MADATAPEWPSGPVFDEEGWARVPDERFVLEALRVFYDVGASEDAAMLSASARSCADPGCSSSQHGLDELLQLVRVVGARRRRRTESPAGRRRVP